jgi:hypothetical protein
MGLVSDFHRPDLVFALSGYQFNFFFFFFVGGGYVCFCTCEKCWVLHGECFYFLGKGEKGIYCEVVFEAWPAFG